MRKHVKQFVNECSVCQLNKADLAASPGLLQPLLIPQRGITKGVGTLASIGRILVQHQFPQSINTTSLEVLYGQPPLPHVAYVQGDNNVDVVDRSMTAKEEAISLLKFHLVRSQVRIENMADKKRSDKEFELNDWVYVKLQPYRKSLIRKGRHHKLSPKFYGLYQIIARIGKVAYRLNLLANSQIHPVFHVSQIKAHKGDNLNTQQALPEVDEDVVTSDKPQSVLDMKRVKKGEEEAEYVLV
ncbi:hypothetical protein Tco_0179973 [Tanacetum coccineum]